MFGVLSGTHLGSGSVRIILITRNTIKQDSLIFMSGLDRFGFIFTGSGLVRVFRFSLFT